MASALERLKNQKTKSQPAKPSKEKAMAKVTKREPEEEAQEGLELPSAGEIEKMKAKDINALHDQLPESIEGWGDMKLPEKREAMLEVLHSEEEEESEEEAEEEIEETEEDSVEEPDEVEAELDKSQKVVALKKGKKAKSKKKDEAVEGEIVTNSSDDMETIVFELENMTESQADAEYDRLSDDIAFNYFRLGGILSVIDTHRYFGEYESFRDKVESEFGMKYSKARSLVGIYNNIIESGVEWSDISSIGWTKMREISHLITPDNVEEWVSKAQAMNVATLIHEVKQLQKSDKPETSKAPKSDSSVSTMSFKFHEDQRETVEEALDKAKDEGDTDVNSVALEYICLDYLAGGKKKTTVRDMTIEEFFQKIMDSHKGDAEAALNELLLGEQFKKVFGVSFEDLTSDED